MPLVPQIQLGTAGGEGGNAFGTLLGLMTALKARELEGGAAPAQPRS